MTRPRDTARRAQRPRHGGGARDVSGDEDAERALARHAAGVAGLGDPAVAWLASRQRGLVSTRQLAECGLATDAVRHRLARGRLTPLYRYVYLVGHQARVAGAAELGAVLSYGSGALLFGGSAVAWYGLADPPDVVHVAVGGRNARGQPGIAIHRIAPLAPGERVVREGVPVTSVARALVDFASMATPRRVERVVSEAVVRRLIDEGGLRTAIEEHVGRPGIAALRDCLGSATATRSEAEELYLSLLRRAGVSRPQVDVRLGRWRVDFFWPFIRPAGRWSAITERTPSSTPPACGSVALPGTGCAARPWPWWPRR